VSIFFLSDHLSQKIEKNTNLNMAFKIDMAFKKLESEVGPANDTSFSHSKHTALLRHSVPYTIAIDSHQINPLWWCLVSTLSGLR
jgi:hypothetical protein